MSDRKCAYVTDFATFDIETTSMETFAFMYIAMFCIGEDVFMVRTWEEVVDFFNIISSFYRTTLKKRYVIYIFNLGFEFQFMRNFFEWEEIFAVDKRVPVRALDTRGLEFRCAWKLTNMSLKKFLEKTKGVIHFKQESKKRFAKGEEDFFDYSIIRTPVTELKDYEYLYCFCDVKGFHEGIETLLEEDTLCSIPITSTGYVRRDCRKAMLSNPYNRKLFQECEFDAFIYMLLRTARRGGDCTSNCLYSSEILHNVDSWDIKSSYPYIMMTHLHPMGKFIPDSCRHIVEGRCYLMVIEFKKITIKDTEYIGYIPFSKCVKKVKAYNLNGRIVKAEYLELVITEFDYKIIHERYDIEEENIISGFSCRGELLPVEFREVVQKYFQAKCDLEDLDRYLYAKSKNKINALFGMMLTDCTHPRIVYNREEESGKQWQEIENDVDEALEDYFNGRNNFLAYQWGVWTVGLARARLSEPYLQIKDYAIYSDTDSWKLIQGYDNNVFLDINKHIIEEAESYDVKPYAFRKDGSKEYLGVWEYEGKCIEFKTLGSKKYAVKKYDKKKGKDVIEVTVSGLSKEDGSEYLESLGGLSAFNDGLLFPEEYSGRTVAVYDDDNSIRQITVDGCTFTTSSSVAVHNTTYTLSRTGEYISLLNVLKQYGITHIK